MQGKKYARQCVERQRWRKKEREREHVSFPRGPVRARARGSPSPSTRHSYPPRRPPPGSYGAGVGRMRDARHASHFTLVLSRRPRARASSRPLLSSFDLRASDRCEILRANRSLAEWFRNPNRKCIRVCARERRLCAFVFRVTLKRP